MITAGALTIYFACYALLLRRMDEKRDGAKTVMSTTICYVARRIEDYKTAQTPEWWNIVRLEDNPDHWLSSWTNVSLGHTLESAMEHVTRLNDGLAAVREAAKR